MPISDSRVLICIGDIHGYITKLQNLWSNLQTLNDFHNARVIFLGDYCDRGPDTRKVLDFLVDLPSKYPNQSHVFLAGNHDFAFAAFLGAIPPPPDGSALCETWAEYEANEEREGWYKGYGYENMHLQGRRWAGKMTVEFNTAKGIEYKGSIYDAGTTFQSYGVPHGSPGRYIPKVKMQLILGLGNFLELQEPEQFNTKIEYRKVTQVSGSEGPVPVPWFRTVSRSPLIDMLFTVYADLMKAVPEEHKKFLADLVWIHEEDNVGIETENGVEFFKLIAVHGGLDGKKDVEEQIKYLKAKDTRISKVEPLSGRKNVWDIPEELRKTGTIVVSGHHGKLHVDGLRLIIDEGGGLEQNPVAAIVLPSKTIVRDADTLK